MGNWGIREVDVSIVIVTYNGREITLQTLRSYAEAIAVDGAHAYEVIVVDNASRDGVADAVAAAHPGVQLIRNTRNLGFAKDIIEFAQEKRYDAIVAGRRGLSRLEKLYTGSVTANILEQSRVIPVWLVNGETAAGDILVAIDGSEACLRVIDHVGFMFSKNTNARVTLLHVAGASGNRCQRGSGGDPDQELAEIIARGEKACIDLFCSQAWKHFEGAGLPRERVKLEIVKGGRKAGKTILEFAAKKKFGTIVVGRRGIDKAFFMGSVSRYLIDKVTNGALWIVP